MIDAATRAGTGNAEASITLHYVVISSGVQTAAKVTSYLVRGLRLHSHLMTPFDMITFVCCRIFQPRGDVPARAELCPDWRRLPGNMMACHILQPITKTFVCQVIGVMAFAGVLAVAAAGVQSGAGSAAGFSPRGAQCGNTPVPELCMSFAAPAQRKQSAGAMRTVQLRRHTKL